MDENISLIWSESSQWAVQTLMSVLHLRHDLNLCFKRLDTKEFNKKKLQLIFRPTYIPHEKCFLRKNEKQQKLVQFDLNHNMDFKKLMSLLHLRIIVCYN